MNIASEAGTTVGRVEQSDIVGLLSRAGVEVAGFKRDGKTWRFPEALMADRLSKGDLKGFRELFPLILETDGV